MFDLLFVSLVSKESLFTPPEFCWRDSPGTADFEMKDVHGDVRLGWIFHDPRGRVKTNGPVGEH